MSNAAVFRARGLTQNGHLSHAYLITGQGHDGRLAQALAIAGAYVCGGTVDKPCSTCPACRKVEAGIHPDVIVLAPEEGKDFTVAQIRALRADAFIQPNESKSKVYIIDYAERMNQNAQNALLKVVEEGPPYAAFLLCAPSTSSLLPTILSRCEILRLAPEQEGIDLPSEDMTAAGEALAKLLLNGNESALMTHAITLEKSKREDLLLLLAATEGTLLARATQNPHNILPLIEQLRTLEDACQHNVGAGHIVGALTAKTFLKARR